MAQSFMIDIKIQPNASKNEIVGWENERLKIKIKEIAEKNKANKELISFLAKTLKIPKSNIQIIQGETSRIKRLQISNFSKEEFLALIAAS